MCRSIGFIAVTFFGNSKFFEIRMNEECECRHDYDPLIGRTDSFHVGSVHFPRKEHIFTTEITFDLSVRFSLCFLLVASAL